MECLFTLNVSSHTKTTFELDSQHSQISSQGTTIEDELRAMILMSSLPSSWETFVTTVCNASTTTIKYSEVTSAILTEAAQRKSFTKDSAEEAYVVQGSNDRSNNRGRSSSRPPNNQRSRSKSRETQICNYCKKPGHIKADYRALKSKGTKLRELIRGVTGMRRSTTSALQPRY